MSDQKSFTLIELLIVIGILAVLVAAVVVTLNPAQLLAQARDSKRQQDLSALNHALNTITTLDQSLFMGTSSIVYTSLPDSTTTCANWNLPSLPSGWQYHCSPTTTLQNTDGNGWIPVNFKTTGVVSLSSLPIDPQNTSSTGLYYTYVSGGSFELTAAFESSKFKLGGDKDIVSTDGGNNYERYELGSDLSLNPFSDSLMYLWWKFDSSHLDDSSRNITDNNALISIDSHPPSSYCGYIYNGVSFTSGEVGAAALFDGNTGFIKAAYPYIPFPVSVSFWANINQYGSGTSTFFQSAAIIGVIDRYTIGVLPTGDICAGNLCTYDTGYYLNVGQWHHVVFTYDSTSTIENIYVDGAFVWTHTGETLVANGIPYVGGSRTASSAVAAKLFNGGMDDLRIYWKILSPADVLNIYNGSK
jgi:prepilin-type N-terminal cleavage/methylation domain-containing protein